MKAWDMLSQAGCCKAVFNSRESTFLPPVLPFGAAGLDWREFGSLFCRSASVSERVKGISRLGNNLWPWPGEMWYWMRGVGWFQLLGLGTHFQRGNVGEDAGLCNGIQWEDKDKGIGSGGERDNKCWGIVVLRRETWLTFLFILETMADPCDGLRVGLMVGPDDLSGLKWPCKWP